MSGNPGGRPRGLARATREALGDDGAELVAFWLSIMRDKRNRTADRLEATKLLAERGWGKAGRTEDAAAEASTETPEVKEVYRLPTPERARALLELAAQQESQAYAARALLNRKRPVDRGCDEAGARSLSLAVIEQAFSHQRGPEQLVLLARDEMR